jgi:hypothetical protein
MNHIFKLSLFLALIASLAATTPKAKWKLAYDQNRIKVYTRSIQSGLSEFKGITTINAPLEQIAALLDNAKNQEDFVYGVKSSYVVKELNPTEKVVYSEVEMPWPLDNRDIVSKTKANYNKQKKVAIIETKATPDYISEKEGLVRMKTAEGYWKLHALGDNKTEVTYQFVSDPEGLPNWVVNMFIVDAPKKTLLELIEMETQLQKSKNDVSWID